MSDWSDQALAMGQPTSPAPAQGADWADAALAMKPGKQLTPLPDLRKPSGLTLFMDPSKFSAIAAGLQGSVPTGIPTSDGTYQDSKNGLSIGTDPSTIATQKQQAADVAAHPNYETGGKILGTTLLGAAGGAEAPITGAVGKIQSLRPLVMNMLKAASMADLSQGGSAAGNALFPGNPLASIAGGLLAPLGAAGALGGVKALMQKGASSLIPAPTADSDALGALSQKFNIPLSLGDMTGQEGKGIGGVERILEKTPGSGMVGYRASQQAAVAPSANNIANNFAANVPEAALDDPQSALQGYLANSEQTARTAATDKYNVFLGKAVQADGQVKLTNLKAAAQTIADEERSLPGDMQSPAYKTAQSILKLPDQMGIKLASTWDQRLGDMATAAQKQFNMGNSTKTAVRHYTMLDQALGGKEGDINAFASTQPDDIVGAYNDAKKFYGENVGPFNDPDIRKIGSDNFDTDTLLNKMVKNNRPQLAQGLMNTLPQDGQATLKYAVINKLMEGANLNSDTKSFSPKLFANAWNRLGKTKDAVFSPQEKTMVDGYSKLLNAVPEPMANPRTGAENTGVLGLVALKTFIGSAGVKAAIPLLLGGRALTRLLTSPGGQKILMNAAKTNDRGTLASLAVSAASTLRNTMTNPGSVGISASRLPQPYPAQLNAPATSQ